MAVSQAVHGHESWSRSKLLATVRSSWPFTIHSSIKMWVWVMFIHWWWWLSLYTHLLLNIDMGSSSDQQLHHFLVTRETGWQKRRPSILYSESPLNTQHQSSMSCVWTVNREKNWPCPEYWLQPWLLRGPSPPQHVHCYWLSGELSSCSAEHMHINSLIEVILGSLMLLSTCTLL